MAITDQDFEIYQGNHKQLIYEVENVTDLTTAIIKWACSKRTTKTTVALSKIGTVIIGSPTKFKIDFAPDDTNDISIGEYYYEVKIKNAEEIEVTVATGKMVILPTLIKEMPDA